ncbi:hypothetical protein RNA01_38700 [Ciceribacter naphthalenivorans]|jgi:hypothetical protein|uniref:Uncharacterized protein n=1 Tax=Ciceribacter naphthalenivorans TaxID=1118451 RepID=A0A512HNA6_9HYPH|nr:hypothetical protein RNA01_38700 [Ciceribacter naphthalenivorans]
MLGVPQLPNRGDDTGCAEGAKQSDRNSLERSSMSIGPNGQHDDRDACQAQHNRQPAMASGPLTENER